MKKTLIAICLTTISFSALMAKDISEKRNLVGINGGVTLNPWVWIKTLLTLTVKIV